MEKTAFGIDLGTSTSEIAYFRDRQPEVITDPETRSPIIPSLVGFDTGGRLLVGERARNVAYDPGSGVREVKRQMGTDAKIYLRNQNYKPEEISAFILRYLRDITRIQLATEVDEVVLSVPANFTDASRAATRAAAEIAGLNVLRMINEPTAAAIAYGYDKLDADEQVVVFDFGGGTLDITVLQMFEGILDVTASYGDTKLGGKDFDEAMRDLIMDKFRYDKPGAVINPESERTLIRTAELCKIALSTTETFHVYEANFAMFSGKPVDLDVHVTRQEFETRVIRLLDRSRDTLRKAMSAKNVHANSIDKILLVGGTTYMPCVRRVVADYFGKAPRVEINPDLAVAMGACIQAGIIKGLILDDKGLIVTDVCPHGHGVRLVNLVDGRLRDDCFEPLIKPNTKVPYEITKRYSLMYQNQDQLLVEVFQDHEGDAKFIREAIDIDKRGFVDNIPPSETEEPRPVDIHFSYDINQEVKLVATIPGLPHIKLSINFNASDIRMSGADIMAARARSEEIFIPDFPDVSTTVSGIESLLTKGELTLRQLNDADDIGRLQNALERVREAIGSGDQATIETAVDNLTDILYDIETRKLRDGLA